MGEIVVISYFKNNLIAELDFALCSSFDGFQ
jgi:hypothetical protein